ncbi:siderophore-interacting protein [Vibrio sonorensis]|uniref:siderophore-interacting protein n=1 Tax=Vibrio sonorensis TaxID=1004316 RepID=UPI0008D99842|nr:siderophore-interacting protein [Vibrio sonorensis]
MSSNERVTPRLIECVSKTYITPNLLRVTFTGEDLKGFPDDKGGAIVKLFLPNQETGTLDLPYRIGDTIHWPENKPVSRAYTIRRYHPTTNQLDIDFVAHSEKSPGSGWAIACEAGDKLGLVGPAGPEILLAEADWHVLLGDLCSLPAICAVLEDLDSDAQGVVLLEVDHKEDIHDFIHPAGVEIIWYIRDGKSDPRPLIDALKQYPIPQDGRTVSAFVAGENETVVACRKLLKNTYGLSKDQMYALPYWKRGKDEDAYHHERHEVMDEEY